MGELGGAAVGHQTGGSVFSLERVCVFFFVIWAQIVDELFENIRVL